MTIEAPTETKKSELLLLKKIPWQDTLGSEVPVYEDADMNKPAIGLRRIQRVKDYFASALEEAASQTGIEIWIAKEGSRSIIFPKDSLLAIIPQGRAEVVLFEKINSSVEPKPSGRDSKIYLTYEKAVEKVKEAVRIVPPIEK